MMPYHCHRCGSNFVITMLLPSLLLFTIVCLRNVNTAKFYEKSGRFNGGNQNNINDRRLHFITEPESVFASTDGRRINFKCMVSPNEAQIKWLLNGTIINDDSYEWIKMNENKLSIKLQKPLLDPIVDEDNHQQNGDHKEQTRSHPYHSHHNSHHHHHHHHQNHQQQNINLQGAVFQCLAEWNNQVIVSQPAKLIIAELSPFDDNQQDINITAISGNNVVIPCELPHSIPVAVAEFEFNNITISNSNISQDRYRILPSGHLLITNVKPFDSGSYRCIAHNPFLQERMFAKHLVNLKVIKQKNASADLKRLKFTLLPKQQIIAILGSNITMECVPHGHPVPKISWTKINGDLPKSRSFVDNGALIITSVQREDEGIYSCNAFNTKTTLDSNTELKVYEMPQIVNDDYEIIEMEKGQNYELFCNAKGQPKPLISWLHNGYFIDSQITNDVFFEQDGAILKIIAANPQLHGGIFQCFATNELGTTYAIKVIQFKSTSTEHQHSIIANFNEFVDNNNANQNNDHKQPDRFNADINFDLSEFSMENNYNPFNDDHPTKLNGGHGHPKKHKHKNKDLKLIPPSKPEVIKLNDESVMVRWHVPKSNGLPIMFFKVQYKELGRGDWNTVDVDIPPHIFSHPVCCLNPNSTYRFRIAAVYSNDDNKTGKSSNKFVFQKDPAVKRPIHPPTILNATSITPHKITVEWEYLNIEMQQVDGFFINYRAADSAGQYLMVTTMGANTRKQNISYLQPNTAYEIKMQCFNEAGTSDFSNIYMVKTMPLATVDVEDQKPPPEKDITKPLMDKENMQLVVILVVSITALLVFIVCATICCMRQKSNQSSSKIKKEKVIKPPSDYYFSSINNYDRRLSNGQLNTISGSNNLALTGTTATIPMLPSVPHANNNHVPDDPTNPNPLNARVSALNEMPTPLNRRNSFRNSLSYSSHHLYSSNGNIKHNENHLNNHETSNGINGASNSGSTATIDRKRPLKNSIPGPYLDQYSSNSKINHHHHSASFTRLNGTLERKRRSRNDLNGIADRNSIYNHRNGGINQNNHSINSQDISASDLDRQCSNGNSSSSYFHHHHHLPQNGGHFVIMQSSC